MQRSSENMNGYDSRDSSDFVWNPRIELKRINILLKD